MFRAFIGNSDFIDIYDITHERKLNLFANKQTSEHIECLFQYAYAAVNQHWLANCQRLGTPPSSCQQCTAYNCLSLDTAIWRLPFTV